MNIVPRPWRQPTVAREGIEVRDRYEHPEFYRPAMHQP